MTKERIGKIFYEKMSGKGVEADLSGQGKNAQKRPLSNKTSEQREDHLAAERKRAPVKRSNETSEQREELLAAERKRAAVKRSNETTMQRKERIAAERKRAAVKRSYETSEQREERLAAQRKRAAAKVFNESSKEREERLRAKRERAAVKLTQETSQEKDIRLIVRRERAALKRQGESPPEGVETNRRANREGTPSPDDEISGRPSLQPSETNICTIADGLTQPRSQALSSHGPRPRRKTLVQAGHVSPKIWEVVKTKTGGGAVESKIR